MKLLKFLIIYISLSLFIALIFKPKLKQSRIFICQYEECKNVVEWSDFDRCKSPFSCCKRFAFLGCCVDEFDKIFAECAKH